MDIDLLFQMDDDLMALIRANASVSEMSVEEWLRMALLKGAGESYGAPPPDHDAIMRPMITLDLRT